MVPLNLIFAYSFGYLFLLLGSDGSLRNAPCDKSRHTFTTTWGIIADGPTGSNYTQDSHCEWLIRAPNETQYITLKFRNMGTECSFDYVFVYAGNSFDAPLLGSFSGKTEPQQVVSSSGSMLILLYSDTNYVLGGFQAEFFVTNCPRNCSSHGTCQPGCPDKDCRHVCVCTPGWGGLDCSEQLCPDGCGAVLARGICDGGRCHCRGGYSGMSCSLHPDDNFGNRWHWLSHSGHGLKPRAAHSAVYLSETDSLYVFGGYDLNNILGDLSIYQFSTSHWVDENGIVLGDSKNLPPDPALLEAALRQDVVAVNPKSFLATFLYPFSENATKTYFRDLDDDRQRHRSSRLHELNDMDSSTLLTPHNDSDPNPTPPPRYGHAAARYPGGLVIHGGKLANGSLSDELWFYEIRAKRWSLRCPACSFRPPPLTRHTITLVDGGSRNVTYLYLFGGSTTGGEFSSKLYRISLVPGNALLEFWEPVRPRGGKELDLRIVAHSTSYHRATDSLLVYGGVMASLARLSKLSDRMFFFKLESQLWTEIHYPRADLPDTYVPHERAFHTASILGNYLLVFGGYSHRHNKEEICYDNQMYFYHLGCHTWVSHEIFGSSENGTRYGKHQGVFAQAADVRGGNTLLVVGGYHGNVNADLWAYTLPPTLASRSGEAFDPEAVCPRHHSYAECASNPECGWCSVDAVCYGRTVGQNCTTNLQTRRCPGICPALGSCHSCLVHGDMPKAAFNGSVAQKLKLGQCTWCVQNARCHHKDDNYGVCGISEDTPSQVPGWWGGQGTEVTQVEECRVKDRRPGLTFVKYKHPANFSHPDFVSIINATTADFDMSVKEMQFDSIQTGSGGGMSARLIGFLRTPESWEVTKETLRMCTSYSSTVLSLSANNSTITNVVANLSAEATTCSVASWPSGETVYLDSGRFLVDLHAKGSHSNPYRFQASRMALTHNKSADSPRVFTFEYLEPYQNGTCSAYTNCLHCLTDSLCGWCEMNSECVLRSSDLPCHSTDLMNWQYLTLQPSTCTNCSNYISCQSCIESQLCEWWADEARCDRRGRTSTAVTNVDECPAPCHIRDSCASCLGDKDRCVWCEATQECFSFSVYTSQYQFGLCREWVDKNTDIGRMRGADFCKNCSKYVNCSTCLHTLSCGWCYSDENPTLGVCVPGDFNQPSGFSCANTINMYHLANFTEEEVGWSYGPCPDVDECILGHDDCHPNATCSNTYGSYDCQCKRGFYGDGHHSCIKTCYEDCVHGRCSMAPDYKCECDLGWTSEDCSVDCGCSNHSTCSLGIGLCDECRDWTTGEFCELCKRGSYGNATSSQGCQPCDCNGHGNESRGLCDLETGVCYCLHNTEGDHCETCVNGYYGDPRNGGICYFQCTARGMVGPESQGIGSGYSSMTPWEARLRGRPPQECLWIIAAPSTSSSPEGVIIQLQIASDINVTCENNAVYVYDGLPELGLTSTSYHNHALGTFCRRESLLPFLVESKTGIMAVVFRQGFGDEGFNATVDILSCPDNCPGGRYCHEGQCLCNEGSTGPNCSIPLCPNNCSSHLKQGVCDRGYGRCLCAPEFGAPDCSVRVRSDQLIFTEIFNSAQLSDAFDHLRKMIPRFGHSVLADRRGSLWMFGGFSPSHGPLNDIRLFDTRNSTWMQITVDSTGDASMPQGRYLHAAEIVSSRREIYVHGGIADKDGTFGLSNNTFRDFWKFSIPHQGWFAIQKDIAPPPLAGHTLTLQKDQESESLVIIGGYSQRSGFNEHVWNYDLLTEVWSILHIKGNGPADVYSHTTVYHEPSKSLYVFGGYSHTGGGPSNKLFALHFPTRSWTLLPSFEEFSRAPLPRFLHSAVATDNYMLIMGGHLPRVRLDRTEYLFAYSFACNQWVRLLQGEHVVGNVPPWLYGQDMASDPESGAIFSVGGFTGGVISRVTRINIPEDLCNLWVGKDKCRSYLGCSFCARSNGDAALTSRCFSSGLPLPDNCKSHNGTLITNNGVQCDVNWLDRRSCNQYRTCQECDVLWPMYWERGHSCHWDGACNVYNGTISDCSTPCLASDCGKCLEKNGCTWSEGACVKGTPSGTAFCAPLCADYSECGGCLSNPGCRWSMAMQECVSPVHQPLYCAGGACGLVLRPDQVDQCPAPCEKATQCSSCLRWTHCGWCADETASGMGSCVGGTMRGPLTETCSANSSWHYVTCPLENECENGHHTCDKVSEVCSNLDEGFMCSCATGYAAVDSHCEPVCSQGCVRGTCIEPDKCSCHFGYVGSNCSIQCQCNGHSDCEGPDKLNKCIECHNNTQGAQCDRCQPLYVGDATNNGSCVPCFDYCHGHSHDCTSDGYDESVCRHCMNNTDGPRCNNCKPGFFRGSEDLRQPCRPCECHGHGDTCDPITGEKCNCTNNTESECLNTVSKNSNQQCWMLQCSKCKETYYGTPTDGHQCYKQMTLDHRFCLDHKLQDECKIKPSPLYPGHSVFIVVQPRYVNVDIRIILDVSEGSLDLRMSPKDDFLVLDPAANSSSQVTWDSKYKLRTGVEGITIMDVAAPLTNKTGRDDKYWSLDQEASPMLTSYVTLRKKNTFLLVRNIRNRLILTLPKDRHDLVNTKFYIALTATGQQVPTYGIIFFRQDQLHIDLFVFFSVFFSCFFLFLAACVVAWKAKQATELRRARRRHVVEMLHMAKRPFAGLVVDLPPEEPELVRSGRRARGQLSAVRPIAIEPTEDGVAGVATVFIQLPGGDAAPVRLALASALILMSRVYPLNSRAFLRRRNSHHGPS